MVASLSELLSTSWVAWKQRSKPIVFGAVFFAVIAIVLNFFLWYRVGTVVNAKLIEVVGLEKMEELRIPLPNSLRMTNQSWEQAFNALGSAFEEKAKGMSDADRAQFYTDQVKDIFISVFPVVSLLLLLGVVLFLWRNGYFISLALGGMQDWMSLLKKSSGLILRMLSSYVWVFLRSWSWLPLIFMPFFFFDSRFVIVIMLAMIPAIIFMPRLALSQIILVKENMWGKESSKMSFVRTQGYWWKVVYSLLVVGLLLGFINMLLSILLAALLDESTRFLVSFFLLPFVNVLLSTYTVIFLTKLAETIMRNPRIA